MRILFVEDDTAIAEGLTYSLESEGYDILWCKDAAGAYATIKNQSFDLALLDITLPDGSGFDICKHIRDGGSQVPIIFLTARDEEVSVVRGLDIGADDYITKPFRIRELLSRIKTVLRRTGNTVDESAHILRLGNITVDTKKAKIYKDDTEILLTALEYRLLLTLINGEGRVLSRNQLLEGIWDVGGEFVNDNTLTVYIKRLREKIEADPSEPSLIVTVRGLGYRIGG